MQLESLKHYISELPISCVGGRKVFSNLHNFMLVNLIILSLLSVALLAIL